MTLAKLVVGSIIFAIGLGAACGIIIEYQTPVALAVSSIIVFSVVLIGGNILSEDTSLNTGEVRRAIAAGSTFMFFGLLLIPDTFASYLDNFWKVYVVIIAFYFTSRAVEKVTNH